MNRFITTQAARLLAPREAAIGDRLPYARHLDAQTVSTRDGLLVQTLHISGFPFETASDEDLNYRKSGRETVLRSAATSRLGLWHHVVRRRVTPEFPPPPEEP
ncbi:MAG: VirB4 family type IV secretion/conjugal transfer ATPase, partial [Phenylobacterium sp.]|nr:VirB4 family type IV secretion/conjugal transfer ATPase [Phenylobacterium sp.]